MTFWTILAVVMAAPILCVGLLLWYSFVAMTTSWVQALLVGMGVGAVVILGTSMQTGMEAMEAQNLFVAVVAGTLILKAAHVYIGPSVRRAFSRLP